MDSMASAQLFTEDVFYGQAIFNQSAYKYYLFCIGDTDYTYGGICFIYYTYTSSESYVFEQLRYDGTNWQKAATMIQTAINTGDTTLYELLTNMLSPNPDVVTDAQYSYSCLYSAANALDCMEFAKLSNVITIRGYQPNQSYQAYPRFQDTTPKVYALYANSSTVVLSTAEYTQIDQCNIGSE